MIFALGRVPKFFEGQELSAQDLNNLAQNVEIMEQVVKGPDRLFLSDWKLAPPVFKLVEQKTNTGDLKTFEGLTFAMSLSEIDVWEGSFLYREGMHTLRLGFNTYALKEEGDSFGRSPVDLKDAYSVNYGKPGDNSKWVNPSTSLFLLLKYTDMPVSQVISKYPKYAISWVYDSSKKTQYKQPSNNSVNSFTLIEDSTALEGSNWNANNVQVRASGYHTYTLDITKYNFVPGEIVSLKFKIKTRDNAPVLSLGRRFYFSMVYANIDHDISSYTWKTINSSSITTLSHIKDVAENQRMLVDYFQKYDIPLRAAVWDQVMAGTSQFPYYGRFQATALQKLASWGLVNFKDYLVMDFNTSEARYYLPMQFDLKNTVSLSYNVAVNTRTAFSMQGLLSKSAIAAYANKKTFYYASTKNAPSFLISFNYEGKDRYPWVVGLGQMNYGDYAALNSSSRFQYANFLARVGLTNFMGKISVDTANDVQSSILPEGLLPTPAGYPDPREFLYMGAPGPTSQSLWQGFYFILPGRITSKVPYYNSTGGNAIGLEEKMFLGPRAVSGEFRDASIYVDNFNFSLKQHTSNSNYYYPAIYEEYGLNNHATYRYTKSDAYTDFTINLKESSPSYTNAIGFYGAGSGMILESFDTRAFNKASYIATFRLAEVTRKTTVEPDSPEGRFGSFNSVAFSGILGYVKRINDRQNDVYTYINEDLTYKYIPVFWTKPKSSLKHYEDLIQGSEQSTEKLFYAAEFNTIYFSNLRQADYLVVRGRNISIGWGGFNRVYRENPESILFPAPLELEFSNSSSLTGSDIETVIIGFDTFNSLAYGERYYIQGDVYYAAETMGIPS